MLAKERLSGQPEAIFGNDFDSESFFMTRHLPLQRMNR
jgi:hypothetical protein